MINIEKTTLLNWQNCIRIGNSHVTLTATVDVGPRIIHLSLPGRDNLFFQNKEQLGLTGGNEWRAYGGHRFWIAPENDRTYFPDNRPVQVETLEDGLRLTPPPEETNGFQKSVLITLFPDYPHIHVIHSMTNHTSQPSSAAPWALSVMDSGGTAILPHSPRIDWPNKLTADNTLSLWSYTAMSDPRWIWGDRYILLRQTGGPVKPQKIGMFNSEGWAAYHLKGMLFIKFFSACSNKTYPDLNSNLETYTNDQFLELETLGPLGNVEPGQTIEHREDWFLFGDVPPVHNDEDVDRAVLPIVQKCQAQVKTT